MVNYIHRKSLTPLFSSALNDHGPWRLDNRSIFRSTYHHYQFTVCFPAAARLRSYTVAATDTCTQLDSFFLVRSLIYKVKIIHGFVDGRIEHSGKSTKTTHFSLFVLFFVFRAAG